LWPGSWLILIPTKLSALHRFLVGPSVNIGPILWTLFIGPIIKLNLSDPWAAGCRGAWVKAVQAQSPVQMGNGFALALGQESGWIKVPDEVLETFFAWSSSRVSHFIGNQIPPGPRGVAQGESVLSGKGFHCG
jgi:hypothetical protein